MTDDPIPEWRLKAREWAARNAERRESVDVEHDADLIPELEYDVNPVDVEVDAIVDGVDILDAYARWCGKSVPDVGKKRESIMISCPRPDHPDKNPSAWINLDKQTWFCGGCQVGGDALDIAAWHFGYEVPAYKIGKSFPDLRRRIAEEFGLRIRKTASGKSYTERVDVVEPEPGVTHFTREPRDDPPYDPGLLAKPISTPPTFSAPVSDFSAPTSKPSLEVVPDPAGAPNAKNTKPDSKLATTPSSHGSVDEDSTIFGPDVGDPPPSEPEATIRSISPPGLTAEEIACQPSIPWRDMVGEEGFLSEWMKATSHDDLPEEYYFTLGLLALGLAVGRDVTLGDNPEVRGNLYICTLGPSGSGKSRAAGVLHRLLAESLPYDESDPVSRGTAFMSPGSAESLIDGFSKPIIDPSDPKVVLGHSGVRGLVNFNELSTLVGRSVRTGSVLKPTLMEFYDGYADVTHRTRGLGMIRAVDHFACAVTTSQPKAIKNLLTSEDADSGFLNRWIFAMGPTKKAQPFGGVSFDIHRAVAALRRTHAWAATTPRVLLPTREALATWSEHFEDQVVPLKSGEEPDAMLARIDLTLKKIMLLLAVDRHHKAIEVEDVVDTLGMWHYLLDSYRYVSGQIGFGPFEEIHQAIRRTLEASAEAGRPLLTMRDISRNLKRRNFQIDLLGRVVQAMVLVGELEEEILKPTRGPATVKYKYIA